MIITKETSRHYAFLMKDHATIYEILARKTKPVSNEASSPLIGNTERTYAATLQGYNQPTAHCRKFYRTKKKIYSNKKIAKEGKEKKKERNGGKTYRVKEICKTSAKRNIDIMFKFQSQQTKKPKSSFLRQLKK